MRKYENTGAAYRYVRLFDTMFNLDSFTYWVTVIHDGEKKSFSIVSKNFAAAQIDGKKEAKKRGYENILRIDIY